MEQWYESVPPSVIFSGAVVVPGATPPVPKAPTSAVAVWVIASALCQATVCPALIVADEGLKDMLPSTPRMLMMTSAPPAPPPSPGAGVVGLEGDEYPHPTVNATARAIPTLKTRFISS